VALIASIVFSARYAIAEPTDNTPDRPNILIIFTDDQGFGDLGCYGSKTIRTPRIDQLAKEGTRFTNFYAQVVCGPSRSALLTGRYPVRSLGWSMPADEITIAEQLKQAGYTTGCIGKWDVSNRSPIKDRMPNAQGFDYYWGTLGANDNAHVVFHHNNEQVGQSSDMASLTRIYTDKAIDFVKQNKDQPFLLYLAHTMVHSVIDASEDFKGKSMGGLYGDTIEELDFETGRLLDTIDQLNLRDNTLVIFTSDNGPWSNAKEGLAKKHNGQIAWGSSGPLREAKGSTYEGGLRVPCIARWPNHIPAGRTSDAIFATIDFMPTFASLAGYTVPDDRIIDGVDQTPLLMGDSSGNRDDYFYFCKGELQAVRKGKWKAMLPDRRMYYGYVDDKGTSGVELYDLATDIGEKKNVADAHPAVVRQLLSHAAALPLPNEVQDNRIRLNNPAQGSTRRELTRGQWKEHGFTAEQLDRVRKAFQNGIDRKFIPGGAMTLIHNGEVILREAFGVADLETNQPFLTSSPVRIASLTKLHTSTVLVMLAEQGLLSLDEPIDTYLPEFANLRVRGKDAIVAAPTLRQCLSHTTGFVSNNVLKSGKFELDLDGSLADVARDLATKELLAEPGKKYGYSRLGYIVAGRVAEIVTGRPFPQLMQKTLLHPIGANDATFYPSPELEQRIPVSYERTEAGFEKRTGEPLGTVINPGGRLISTLDDVARVLLLHRNHGKVAGRQLVSAESLQQMYVPQPSTPGAGYGLGFNIMKRNADGTPARIRHTGASGTLAVLDFENDAILIVLTQVPQQQTLRWRNRLVETVFATFNPDAKRP
tara:strand:- start:331843 stop:334296 length:2454 start_codon:yes stop_codon:yes gene_type:complete